MTVNWVVVFLTLASLAAPGRSFAYEIEAETLWLMAGSKETSPITVKAGEFVLTSQVVPEQLAVLDDDIRDEASGKIVLPAGSQLIRVHITIPAVIFCSTIPNSDNALDVVLFRTPDTYVCAIDVGGDSKFDQYYRIRAKLNFSFPLPVFTRGKETGIVLDAKSSYHLVDRENVRQKYFFGVRYDGRETFGSRQVFRLYFGTPEKQAPLTEQVFVGKNAVQEVFNIAGAVLKLESVNSGIATLSVIRGIQNQPLVIGVE